MKKDNTIQQLTNKQLIAMYKIILVTRKTDERLWILNRAGILPFVISVQGHELAQVAICSVFNAKTDYIVPYYRDLGALMTFGVTPYETFLGSLGRATDPTSNGRQMPSHYGDIHHNIVSGSGPVTTQYLHAAGIALGMKLQKKKSVVYTACGEGATAEGDFHEALNFASIHKLAVLFVIQNNGYAISTPKQQEYACKNLSDRAIGYGIDGYTVQGNDVEAIYAVAQKAYKKAIQGKGPSLIEVLVPRITSHSSDDDHKVYRSSEEITQLKENDPIVCMRQYILEKNAITEQELQHIEKEIAEEVNNASEQALAMPFPNPEDALGFVYYGDKE